MRQKVTQNNKLFSLSSYFHTVKYLKVKQVFYRFYYRLRKMIYEPNYSKTLPKTMASLVWKNDLIYPDSYLGNQTFSFLNIKHKFSNSIDWNIDQYGKLWTYQLNYFDFLNQQSITPAEGLGLIRDYIKNDPDLKDGKDPYPISLRAINWIKFLSGNGVSDEAINRVLFQHYQILRHHLEYHLMGNHLLENGFSLFFGACFFKDNHLFNTARKLLKTELAEQILNDGGHFERSPMYHQLLLHRLLDCLNLSKINHWPADRALVEFLEKKAIAMLSWLSAITYKNGDIPLVKDSAFDIAFSSDVLFRYAGTLGLSWGKSTLSDSGYRKLEMENYELFVDIGSVAPAYQPGHAHADTFSFELRVNQNQVFVDPGVSTYEDNFIRQRERSTAYHNTVTVGNMNSSQVWGSFRVAKRAKVKGIKDEPHCVAAKHNGFKSVNISHQRTFQVNNEVLLIEDLLEGPPVPGKAHFHLHPDCEIRIAQDSNIVFLGHCSIHFEGATEIAQENYEYPLGFNKRVRARKITVAFNQRLSSEIKFGS